MIERAKIIDLEADRRRHMAMTNQNFLNGQILEMVSCFMLLINI